MDYFLCMQAIELKKIGERIRKLRRDVGCTQADFAEALQTYQSIVSDVEKGSKAPTLEMINFVCNQTGVTSDWVLFGSDSIGVVAEPPVEYTVTLPVRAMAGAGSPCCIDQLEPIGNITLDKSYDGPNIQVLQIRGNSMEPTIMDGAHVGIDITEKEIISGQMYAVFIPHEGIVVKRIWIGPELIKISSDNPGAPDHDMMAERINWDTFIQGRVKWTVQKYS